jgi:tRNA1Val (adenine37-N6)-methyltransferase
MLFLVQEPHFNLMGNHYFRFKQFTVYQDACAMKVCTDACIQGAYTAQYALSAQRIMDIGAGTGLLSLMLAQQLPLADITAIELDAEAAEQAAANMAASPWADRLRVLTADARELPVGSLYDFIITNPPFYEGDLKSNDKLRNQAMHATTLDYTSLLKVIGDHLTADGAFSILLPARPFAEFLLLAAAAGFHAQHVLHVRQSVQHDYFRSVGIFSRREVVTEVQDMAIRDAANVYTPVFTDLLKPYYLYL